MLGAVLGPAAHVGLDDVAAVQEGHLAVGLDPDLVARVLGQDRQRGDVQPELARLGELAEADAEGDELLAFCFFFSPARGVGGQPRLCRRVSWCSKDDGLGLLGELTDGHGKVGYAEAHIVDSVLVYSEYIAVGVG